MIKKACLLWNNFLLKGSLIVFLGSMAANAGAYVFHLLMGRMLGPENYGLLESLLSFFYWLGVPASVLAIMVVKYVSQNKGCSKEVSEIVSLFFKKTSAVGLVVLFLFCVSYPFLKTLFKINSFSLILGLGIAFYLSLLSTVLSSSLQGIMEFFRLSTASVLGSFFRLIFSVAAVWIGWKIGGVIWALAFSNLVLFWVVWKMLQGKISLNFSQKSEIDLVKGIKKFGLAAFFSSLSLTSFFTVDIILARYFLTPLEAGKYAALSIFGKIIFFASNSVVAVMFPMISERYAQGKNYRKILILSFLLVAGISTAIMGIYFFFPNLMVQLLYGQEYLSIIPNLLPFAVFASLYSLGYLWVNFYLSISETKIVFLTLSIAFLQIIFIFFHHQSITEIIVVNIFSMILLLAGLLSYYFKIKKEKMLIAKLNILDQPSL